MMTNIFKFKLWIWFFILQFPIFTTTGILEAASWAFLGLGIYILFEELYNLPKDGIYID